MDDVLQDGIANPGLNGSVVLYETPDSERSGSDRRFMVMAFTDQAATLLHEVKLTPGADWRTVNGNGSGETIAASTLFQRDILLMAGRQRVRITTTTAPTVFEVATRRIGERALGQGDG